MSDQFSSGVFVKSNLTNEHKDFRTKEERRRGIFVKRYSINPPFKIIHPEKRRDSMVAVLDSSIHNTHRSILFLLLLLLCGLFDKCFANRLKRGELRGEFRG